jgi:hypothetical protein
MPTTLSASAQVPADVETVLAALTSEGWPQALDARLRDGSRLVRRETAPDGGLVLVTSRRLPEGTPSVLVKATGGVVTQTDTWGPAVDGGRRGTWTVDVPGTLGSIGGATALEAAGTDSRWVVEGAVEVRLPLVGGKTERYLAPLVEKLVRTQAEVLRTLVQP